MDVPIGTPINDTDTKDRDTVHSKDANDDSNRGDDTTTKDLPHNLTQGGIRAPIQDHTQHRIQILLSKHLQQVLEEVLEQIQQGLPKTDVSFLFNKEKIEVWCLLSVYQTPCLSEPDSFVKSV
jgi:hypothetical protein